MFVSFFLLVRVGLKTGGGNTALTAGVGRCRRGVKKFGYKLRSYTTLNPVAASAKQKKLNTDDSNSRASG